jgi:predicted RNase H-like HicB family nuclease
MDTSTYPITLEREGRKYWAYSEDFPGVYGLGNSTKEAKTSIHVRKSAGIPARHDQHWQPHPMLLRTFGGSGISI